ncbi:MAG: winged helix-turn-helix domain-containing protein, partial [bacterium]|nr:winged helix-turn-helix domain-containing protein [bacterium]
MVANNGQEGLEMALKTSPDLIILDIMLPKLDGFQVCREIRRSTSVPIIMLTAKEMESDKIRGLDLGADDYMTKPFSPREFIARVKAQLRRGQFLVNASTDPHGQAASLSYGLLSINLAKYEVCKNGTPLDLTVREYELIKYLAINHGKVFEREHLLREVWGYEYFGDVRTVDVTIRRLREKVEDDPSEPQFVLTRRGVGYYFHPVE